MFVKVVLVLFLTVCLGKSADVTFKNVTFYGYSLFTGKTKNTIALSNSLKDFLPKPDFPDIEFHCQNIPVLYEDSLADLDHVTEVVIRYCGVFEIQPGALKNVPEMAQFTLIGNKIEEIKEGVFNNLSLSILDLSNNLLSKIHSNAFNDMPSLLHIYLENNRIARWDQNWFKNTPLLDTVLMHNNSITKIPNQAFKNFAGSRKFGKKPINLLFSFNKIKTIEPEAFSDVQALHYLCLDYNKLEEFDENLLDGVDVKDLRLDNNNIRCLKGDLAKIIKGETNQFDSNPFDCECVNTIREWATKNDKNVGLFPSEKECAAQRIRTKWWF